MRCDQCEIAVINGIRCHELGCPEAWKDEIRWCKFCGVEFVPETRHQDCCDETCDESYHCRWAYDE